jgi:hypothetical protein
MSKSMTPTKKKPTPKRTQQSIRHDAIKAHDYLNYTLPWSCEDCSHYDPTGNNNNGSCTFGYHVKWHKKDYQIYSYELRGKMALCRFQEID